MRLLLDTHAMYWYLEGSPELSATAQRLIQDASNDILLSPASYWEIAIKISLAFLKEHAGVPVFDAKLDDLLLPKPGKKVKDGIQNARLILMTSQEIDELGEAGNLAQARVQPGRPGWRAERLRFDVANRVAALLT